MRHRTLAMLLALTAGDYLLWKWSLAGGHDVLALIAGVTLLPLAVICAGGLGLLGASLLARSLGVTASTARGALRSRRGRPGGEAARGEARTGENGGVTGAPRSEPTARKLAA